MPKGKTFTEELVSEAKAAGIEVTVTTAPPATTGKVVLLPGARQRYD